jgi:branched-chain amino acid aminotransferase
MNIKLSKVKSSKISKVDFSDLGFCKYYTDHMFVCEYENNDWKNFRIIPFQDLNLSPACTTLHYGQTIFEGLKAYKNEKDEILIFRPDKNAKRFNSSAERMCMPTFPEKYFINSIEELLKIEKDWIPKGEENSLYIRPLMFAIDPYIGIKPADKYLFIIICGLAGGYYSEPVNVKIETEYTRAVKGGVGYAKTAANYAAALYPAVQAQKEGFHQLIWTDGKEHNFVEESGTMNLFFVIDNKLITPPLGDTVLDGVTRDSIISVCPELDIDIEIRKISVKEIIDALGNGSMTEAFGAGTAATIAPIKTIAFQSKKYNLPENNKISFSKKILDYLNNLKFGKIDDKFNWVNRL